MAIMDLIHSRVSTRRFVPGKAVPKEKILKCLEAARLAPSACNGQPWRFVVVDDPSRAREISEKIYSKMYSMNEFACNASVLIAVVTEKGTLLSSLGGQIRNIRYHLIDLGIACEHLVLQAEELGLATCWIGWFDEKPLKKALQIPRGKKVEVVIAMGYSAEAERKPKRRKELGAMSSFGDYLSE